MFRNIIEVCDRLNIIHDLNPVDWDLLKCIRDLLAPFATAVKRLECELCTTILEVYPVVFGLKAMLRQVCKLVVFFCFQDNGFLRFIYLSALQVVEQQATYRSIAGVTRILLNQIDLRFSKVFSPMHANFDPIYVLATFLDSRFSLMLHDDLVELAKQEIKILVSLYFVLRKCHLLWRRHDDFIFSVEKRRHCCIVLMIPEVIQWPIIILLSAMAAGK